MRPVLLVLPWIFVVACVAAPAPKTEDSAKDSAPPGDPEEPPTDPNADPLLVAATRICELVDHKDDAVLAAAFVPEFFDTTPPPKLDRAFFEVRGALGRCGEHMIVVQRRSPIEGVVAVECEHGVLMLTI